jgi:hypothetical protein
MVFFTAAQAEGQIFVSGHHHHVSHSLCVDQFLFPQREYDELYSE